MYKCREWQISWKCEMHETAYTKSASWLINRSDGTESVEEEGPLAALSSSAVLTGSAKRDLWCLAEGALPCQERGVAFSLEEEAVPTFPPAPPSSLPCPSQTLRSIALTEPPFFCFAFQTLRIFTLNHVMYPLMLVHYQI